MVPVPRGRVPWGLVAAAIAVVAGVAMGVSAVLLSRWSTLRPAAQAEAERIFDSVREHAAHWGDAADRSYLSIDATGRIHVDRRLEHERPVDLGSLHLLAWDEDSQRLLDAQFPWWFVRLKMNDRINLGTFTTALSGDWEHLDLKISIEELRRRGPGIVLDHTRADSSRVLLWSEPREAP